MKFPWRRGGMRPKEPLSTLDSLPINNYTHFLEIPLKIVGCWDWYDHPKSEKEIIINNVYFCMVLFVLINVPATLYIHLYTEWVDVMTSLDKLADCLPFVVSIIIVVYFGLYRKELYELTKFMQRKFHYRSANGLTNMTMLNSYKTARNFGYFYTACTMFSVSMYMIPEIVNRLKRQPLQSYMYMDVTRSPFFEFTLLRQCVAQAFVGLAMGQFGVFFASNAILLCGQLDLLCCSLRNARYTALLRCGVSHRSVAAAHSDIQGDELYNYIYNIAEMRQSIYHYDQRMSYEIINKRSSFDIYSSEFDAATCEALRDCARACDVINTFKAKFESFVSPLLALRVVQVTMYLCMLLYAATLKLDMVTVEYLVAVALDIFVYCFYGNQIIIQADRVSTAAYQSSWPTMGVRPRRLLLNILLANKRPVVVRAGNFLSMDLHTFVVIIKTSFSYYTLLVNVNEK
ncbi:putative odorant receptor 85e [Ostrinia nubilalis]|uniref:putative odorant receptor 85e n=1 Tax=Ostrinia nubilalis TaxID=29057 RepID=UPI003082247A